MARQGRHIVTGAFGFLGRHIAQRLLEQGQQVATIRGEWKGWNFNIVDNQGIQLATVTKKWAGLGKELLTSADNYVVDTSSSLKDQGLRKLILAAAIGMDMVLKNQA